MPHYKDGTLAKVGDLVKGKSYNEGASGIVGTVIQIRQDTDTCNCVVAYTDVLDLDKLDTVWTNFSTGQMWNGSHKRMFLIPKVDYGELRAFEKVTFE